MHHPVWTTVVICLIAANVQLTAHAQTKEAPVELPPEDRIESFFEEAHKSLGAALKLFDDAADRPSKGDLAFYDFLSKTKESQKQKVESYLDAAGEALGVSSLSARRNRITELRETINQTQRDLTTYRRKRISAPDSTFNPLVTTKDGYDELIQEGEDTITLSEQQIDAEKERLVQDFARIGMNLDAESVDQLLDSITGDEFVRVTVVFDNAKRFAAELERLTNDSNEDLEAAKHYYGVYLMLLQAMSRLQQKFIANVDEVYFPKLDEFTEKARENINEAEAAIKLGGDEQILRNNITSNQLTYDAALLYKDGLKEQRRQMVLANEACKKNILTAENTYKTVSLSKDLADLMSESRRAFDAISGLAIPDLRPFKNERLKDAFSKITRELRK